jgi:LytR cell envelope-related transcriptional attenuator
VGAHRSQNPRLWTLAGLLWALLAIVVLAAVGIFGSLVLSGRITPFPITSPTLSPTPVVSPVLDTSYSLVVLNATGEQGLGTAMAEVIVAAGWSPETVEASTASVTDFAETTVYYALPSDEAAARGLADVIGGAKVAQDDIYQLPDDPNTPDDESQSKQLTVVIGLDRTTAGSSTPTSTP